MNKESVGIVETKYLNVKEPIELDSGQALEEVTIAYETYGELNKEKSNAILIDDVEMGVGKGKNKKEAEQAAAKVAIEKLNIKVF